MTPTPQQQAITDAMASPDSLMISAYAGCAKTSTLAMAGPRVKKPALALAFNKAIAQELGSRLPGNFSVKTLNGLGHAAWLRSRGQSLGKVLLDDRKMGKLVTQAARSAKTDLSSDQWDLARCLASRAMQAGIVPGDAGAPLAPDTEASWAAQLPIEASPEDFSLVYPIAREALIQSIALAKQGVLSFDDQVYCPTVLGGVWPRFPVVFVDEAQDLSPLNHRMIQLASTADAKLVVVGDPCQAIYAFRGADSESMQTLRGLRSSWTDLPLTVTFRCPKVIVARNRGHAPGFAAAEANPEGEFRARPNGAEGWGPESFAELPAPLAILCRHNAPLLSLAFQLLRAGVGVKMLGRDIGKGLVALSKKIAPDDATGRDRLAGVIKDWEVSERSKALANDQEKRAEAVTDQAECLLAVLSQAAARDAGQLRALLAQLFARVDGLVTLSSIHKAKGLEWGTVVHLDPWRVKPKADRQEANLLYVAETRTRHTLVEAGLDNFQA